MRDDTRTRVLAEIQRIHREIVECAHCAALRSQHSQLSGLLPPDPITANGKLYTFMGNPEYNALVESIAARILPGFCPVGIPQTALKSASIAEYVSLEATETKDLIGGAGRDRTDE